MLRLKTRLFLWFLAAIVFAMGTSTLTVALMRPEAPPVPSGPMARNIASRLETLWDDAAAAENYVAEMRELSGYAFELRRDPHAIPENTRRGGPRGRGPLLFDRERNGYIPVVKRGEIVGAVTFPAHIPNTRWWRLFAGLLAGALVLALAADRVSRDLARPLERVADAAHRFGGGELGARTGLGGATARKAVADEVHQVATAFDAMAERVERTLRDQRELLAAISHELRSPLGRARVALEIAREQQEERHGSTATLDRVERQLVEVDAILSDLLAVTRAGLTDLRTEKVGYLAWVRARMATERAGDVELVIEDESIETAQVTIDGALLGRALHNLLANARAHGHPETEPLVVEVSRRSDGKLRTTVRDRGPGIAAELLPRIFDPFVRGDVARARPDSTAAGGSGLGLALVRRIIEAHGGAVFAQNGKNGAEVGFDLALG
ncbi:ATP-binding protein [Pendulispora rubella]|uniref:histidine kinase n=1 Tax=Pendulispora rubella TaxID=2741070 RepID=A0ABZ2L630_9BACT